MGRDGRTAYFRLYGRDSTKAILEIGEQIMAKPLRGRKSNKRLSLKERWVFATWVGVGPKTNEHVVVLGDGGAAIRVIKAIRAMSDRWNPDVIKAIRATPRVPNPRDKDQVRAMPDDQTKKIELGEDGSQIPLQPSNNQLFKYREFKITKGILEKYGFSDSCKGCDAFISGGYGRLHDEDCRSRLEQLMKQDVDLRMRLDLRDVRLERETKPAEVTTTRSDSPVRKLDGLLAEEEIASEEVVSELLQNKSNIVDAAIPEEVVAEENTRKRGEVSENNEAGRDDDREVKKRRLRVLASEKRLLGRVSMNYETGSARRKINLMLNTLEFGAQHTSTKQFDISSMIGALTDDEATPHDEWVEMERWHAMYDGVDFINDMNNMKPLNRDMVVEARRLVMKFLKK